MRRSVTAPKATKRNPRLIDDVPPHDDVLFQADLAWQVRAWGRRVLAGVRSVMAERYPTYAEFQPLEPGGLPFEKRSLVLLVPDETGETDAGPLNDAFERRIPQRPAQPPLGGETDGGVFVGAHGALQGLPGDAASAQDALAR